MIVALPRALPRRLTTVQSSCFWPLYKGPTRVNLHLGCIDTLAVRTLLGDHLQHTHSESVNVDLLSVKLLVQLWRHKFWSTKHAHRLLKSVCGRGKKRGVRVCAGDVKNKAKQNTNKTMATKSTTNKQGRGEGGDLHPSTVRSPQ